MLYVYGLFLKIAAPDQPARHCYCLPKIGSFSLPKIGDGLKLKDVSHSFINHTMRVVWKSRRKGSLTLTRPCAFCEPTEIGTRVTS